MESRDPLAFEEFMPVVPLVCKNLYHPGRKLHTRFRSLIFVLLSFFLFFLFSPLSFFFLKKET